MITNTERSSLMRFDVEFLLWTLQRRRKLARQARADYANEPERAIPYTASVRAIVEELQRRGIQIPPYAAP